MWLLVRPENRCEDHGLQLRGIGTLTGAKVGAETDERENDEK